MTRYRPNRLIALFAGLLPLFALAEDCEEQAASVRHGGLLWTEGALIVQGTAAPNLEHENLAQIKLMAQRGATVDAYRKAATILSGVRVTPTRSVNDIPGATTKVDAIVKGAVVCKTKFYKDGGVDVAIKLPLAGTVATLEAEDMGTRPADRDSDYEQIVIDARHLDFAPALVPRLLDHEGHVLFDVSRLLPTSKGVGARYVLIDENERDDTYVTKAVSLGAESPSDLVVDKDAASVLEEGPRFLGNGNVTIVIREPQPVACQNDTNDIEDMVVDWQRRLLFARGHGQANFEADQDEAVRMRLMERAAEVDAERLLTSEAVSKLGIDTEGELKQVPLTNSVRCGAKYFKDGKAEVVLAVPFDGLGVDAGWAKPNEEEGEAIVDHGVVTGIVIDASGFPDFSPSLAPYLVSADGHVVYGAESVSRAYGTVHGGAIYYASLDAAKQDRRMGSRAYVIRATGVDAIDPRSLLISEKDAETVSGLGGVLRRGAVAVVVDEGKLRQ